jgi:hypothetical protein
VTTIGTPQTRQHHQPARALCFSFAAALLLIGCAPAADSAKVDAYAERISPLIDPAKLATLGSRGANPRVQKYVAILAEAKTDGVTPKKLAARAVALVGLKGRAASLTIEAMARNLVIAERLGCLDAAGLGEMRHGEAPIIQRGPYRGEKLSVDHIIPRSVVPELDNVIANLELLPVKLNEAKNAKIGARQLDLACKLHKAGLLSSEALNSLRTSNALLTEPSSASKRH